MTSNFSDEQIKSIAAVLNDANRPLKERFRALFTLRNLGKETSIKLIFQVFTLKLVLGGPLAVKGIADCFNDPSALLKHELAYCLGQMQDASAIPILTSVLRDINQEPMVRHEAGEALGAIGKPESLPVLKELSNDARPEVAETCQLAAERIEWLLDENKKNHVTEALRKNPYCSVDPTPDIIESSTEKLRDILLNESLSLFERYRAMFALRNKGDDASVAALAEGLKCSSALFRHEVAYVLGQVQSPVCIPQLIERLELQDENEMVRHECAEALGSIANDSCREILEKYLADGARVVKESCEVALDMCEYENSPEFQYADGLVKLQSCE